MRSHEGVFSINIMYVSIKYFLPLWEAACGGGNKRRRSGSMQTNEGVCFLLLFNLWSICFYVRCKRKKMKWRHVKVQKKDTKWWYILYCYFIFISTNSALFHTVVRYKPKKTKLWHAARRCVFSVVIIQFRLFQRHSFSVLLRYKRRRRSDGMWSNESMCFLLLLFNSRLFHWVSFYLVTIVCNNIMNIQFPYSSS